MGLKSRLISVLCIICFLSGVLYFGFEDFNASEEEKEALRTPKQTIRIWYTDETLKEYIESVALTYFEETDVRVEPSLMSGREYLEQIHEASVRTGNGPDMFIIGNDSLGKAYLAGLASEVLYADEILNRKNYSKTALDAITYKSKCVGYPFYFETSFLLYNKTLLETIAEVGLNTDALEEESTTPSDEISEADVIEKAQDFIPNTIDDILTFAHSYDAPENVESIFKWDVNDIFYNYFFTGNYSVVGGDSGDNSNKIDIYNENAIACLQVYQNLNQFFSIDAEEVTYDSVIQEFVEGKTIFTVATTDAIARLEAAKKEGLFTQDYGVATMPNLNDTLKSRSLSVTSSVVINGYSSNKKEANAFAKYLTFDYVDNLYSRTGKVPSKEGVKFELPALNTIMEEYQLSIPMPKMLETSNYWVELEVCFTKAWLGEDVNSLLMKLSEDIMSQVTGESYKEQYVETPVVEELEFDDETVQ